MLMLICAWAVDTGATAINKVAMIAESNPRNASLQTEAAIFLTCHMLLVLQIPFIEWCYL